MFCSTIIPTVGRETLPQAVASVADQEFSADGFEVIVVNDTGWPLPPASWQRSPRVRVVTTRRRERSVARNTGAAVAEGRYLHFLDDDDVLLPGALQVFWELAQTSDAPWLYGGWQAVNNDGVPRATFRPELHGDIFALVVAGENIPLQASLVDSRQFFAAGAFDPLITGSEDLDLMRRVALSGTVAGITTVVASIRVGPQGSTTNLRVQAETARWGREKVLRERQAFERALASATTDYWRGRVSRAYLASMLWNYQRRDLLTGTARALCGALLAGRHGISAEFWRGLRVGQG